MLLSAPVQLSGRLFRQVLPPERALRQALEELGPIFIKFGQILSTRADLLDPRLIEELSELQDKVAPCSKDAIHDTLRQALGEDWRKHFSYFNDRAHASASVAQVHLASLKKEGADVAVKIIKPDIAKRIAVDLRLLYFIAALITGLFRDTERLRLKEVIAEFEHTLEGELDMQLEGANAAQLRRNFAHSDLLVVPHIYWDYSSDKVLVMERIEGIPIDEVDQLRKHDVDLRVLAEKGQRIFFMQVFRDAFFHADMHPGNIFVDITNPRDPVYKGVDFGIMGSLADNDKKYLALNFLAFLNRDYRHVAELHINCGWVAPDTRVDQLEAAIRGVCEPVFAKSLEEISFGKVLTRLLYTASKFNMKVQPQLLLLQKTLINVEGLGRRLYPRLNVWDTAKPYLMQWMKQENSPRHVLKEMKRRYPEILIRLPDLAANALFLLENSSRRALVEKQEEQRTKRKRRQRKMYLRLFWLVSLVLAALAGSQL